MSVKQYRPRKRWGQNFLQDRYIIEQIVGHVNPTPEQTVVEIGPGRGALTEPLIDQGLDLVLIELDPVLAANLKERWPKLAPDRIINQDILQVDVSQLPGSEHGLKIVGNLPYNISTPILFHLLQHRHHISDIVVMLQKEVVDRIVAGPGSKTYGRLSVMLQWFYQVEKLLDVPATAFTPAPQVESAVVRLTPYQHPDGTLDDFASFKYVVTQAFNKRRKTLANSLRPGLTSDDINQCGIDPKIRPEQLAIPDFVQLAQMFYHKMRKR